MLHLDLSESQADLMIAMLKSSRIPKSGTSLSPVNLIVYIEDELQKQVFRQEVGKPIT